MNEHGDDLDDLSMDALEEGLQGDRPTANGPTLPVLDDELLDPELVDPEPDDEDVNDDVAPAYHVVPSSPADDVLGSVGKSRLAAHPEQAPDVLERILRRGERQGIEDGVVADEDIPPQHSVMLGPDGVDMRSKPEQPPEPAEIDFSTLTQADVMGMTPEQVQALQDPNHPEHENARNAWAALQMMKDFLGSGASGGLKTDVGKAIAEAIENGEDGTSVYSSLGEIMEEADKIITNNPDVAVGVMTESGTPIEVRGVGMPHGFWQMIESIAKEQTDDCPNPECNGHHPQYIVGRSLMQFWVTPHPEEVPALISMMLKMIAHVAQMQAHGMVVSEAEEVERILAIANQAIFAVPVDVMREAVVRLSLGALMSSGQIPTTPEALKELGLGGTITADDTIERAKRHHLANGNPTTAAWDDLTGQYAIMFGLDLDDDEDDS